MPKETTADTSTCAGGVPVPLSLTLNLNGYHIELTLFFGGVLLLMRGQRLRARPWSGGELNTSGGGEPS